MAIDTRDKRFSMLAIGSGLFKAMPNPDGGFGSAADRQMLAYMYSGIVADAPTVSASSFGTNIRSAVWPVVRSPIIGV